jgi:integrating conjugative element protein (TIGR03756 family)
MKLLGKRIIAFIIYISIVNTTVHFGKNYPIGIQSNSVYAKTFTGADVIADAHSFQCLDYEIIMPICVYLLIIVTPFGVYFRWYYRDRINHNLPDLVVTSFEEPGKTPWEEIRETYGDWAVQIQNSSAIRGEFDDHGLTGAEHENKLVSRHANTTVRNNRFHEVNVVGSPAPEVIRDTMKYGVPAVLGSQYLCKSNVTKYRPYLMTEADAVAWRKPELEVNQSWRVPGLREIGSKSLSNLLGNTWGKVIPRTGYVLQSEPSKAAAVTAQRGIDIVTQKNQIPHIYQSYGTSAGEVQYIPVPADDSQCEDGENGGGFGEWERDPYCEEQYNNGVYINSGNGDDGITPTLDEECPLECYAGSTFAQQMPAANEKKKAWQMLVPEKQNKCEAFGSSSLDWPKKKNNEEGEYGWNYWREYECCKPAPGILLNP